MTNVKLNHKNRTIELNKTFAQAASLFGSDEYSQLQTVRRDYPNYRIVTIKQKSSANNDSFNPSFIYMDKYVKEHNLDESAMNEYLNLRGLTKNWVKDNDLIAADYQVVKDWFFNTFEEFEKARAERQALLKKIQEDKEKRLMNRKYTTNSSTSN